jgi:hypothetical protein
MHNAIEPFSFLAGNETLGPALDGWSLDQLPEAGGSDRTARVRVHFQRPFRSPPLIHLGLGGFDVSNEDAARVTVSAANITYDGFEIVLSTWLNTRIWRAEVNWLAIGS